MTNRIYWPTEWDEVSLPPLSADCWHAHCLSPSALSPACAEGCREMAERSWVSSQISSLSHTVTRAFPQDSTHCDISHDAPWAAPCPSTVPLLLRTAVLLGPGQTCPPGKWQTGSVGLKGGQGEVKKEPCSGCECRAMDRAGEWQGATSC